MKRSLVLLATVALLAVGLSIGWFALADRGSLPHDGGCASYCARAIVYEDFDGDGVWQPLDADGDGKVETCLRELDADGEMCIKSIVPEGEPACPEVDEDGDGVADRCVQPGDGWGVWCRLMHGKDTH